MINKYQKGYRAEREIKLLLEAKGFTCIRSAGSHSAIDILAFRGMEGYVIQVKNSKLSQATKLKICKSLAKHQHYIFLKPLVLSSRFKEELEALGLQGLCTKKQSYTKSPFSAQKVKFMINSDNYG